MKAFLLFAAVAASLSPFDQEQSISIQVQRELTSRLSNVHLTFRSAIDDTVTYTYGACDSISRKDAYHIVGTTDGQHVSRLVWKIPERGPSSGCISAWSSKDQLLGRSEMQQLQRVQRRALARRQTGIVIQHKAKLKGEHSYKVLTGTSDRIEMTAQSGIDVTGPWFDGVELLANKNTSAVDVESAKSKDIAIVGAGMAGLMTYLVLHQAGFTNVSILEAGERLGGRVRTAYLTGGPFNYSYQDMGPMRFPYTWKNPVDNLTYPVSDQKLVFDLAKEMNKINGNNHNYSIDFIPWIENNENCFSYFRGYKLPSGLPPTLKQVAEAMKAADSSSTSSAVVPGSSTPPSAGAVALSNMFKDKIPDNLSFEIVDNIYKAHAEFIKSGLNGTPGDHWSEFGFLVNYLNGSLEDAAEVIGADLPGISFWHRLYASVYAAATTWRTVDGGLERLPYSFYPLVSNVTTWNRQIERVEYDNESNKVALQWHGKQQPGRASYDYAIISAPFSVIRRWRLPYTLSQKMTGAINNMQYNSACKVALEYSERFWERYDNPIFGGCNTATDIPGIGTICYPSYNLNSTGPATIVASYVQDEDGERWACLSEEDHVAYVLDAMTEIHGNDTRALYTGKYDRRCWILDPLASGGWGSPTVGQNELYIPEYFKTHENMIFVGEHTAYTQAWINSALESGVRGAVQLMLELGLVDEAKDAVTKWMARWIEV